MKYPKMSCIRMLTFGVTLTVTSAAAAQSPSSSNDEDACSNRTLRGDYGAKIEGTILAANWPLRTLVLFRFDGHGSISSRSHVVLNGKPPAEEWTTAAGTYSVNSDCTGSASIEGVPQIQFHFVVVNGGRQFYLVVDGNAITGEARKLQ